ncbi:hypothetical protein GQ44DRAFT_712547 [Phaeosphaeriaceae sp. PMI808]|nr:hypothetical protein GQ44DRAFT_712547 [Phaeosphaeriaceae sp. PMI808]
MGHINLFARFMRCSPLITRKSFHLASQLILSDSAGIRPPFRHQIYPRRSSSRTMIESPQVAIRRLLAEMPINRKWGWVMYRCTYTDDKTWAQFRAHIEAKSRESIARSDAPEIFRSPRMDLG